MISLSNNPVLHDGVNYVFNKIIKINTVNKKD